MRIQDDWCRVIKASPRPRAWPEKKLMARSELLAGQVTLAAISAQF